MTSIASKWVRKRKRWDWINLWKLRLKGGLGNGCKCYWKRWLCYATIFSSFRFASAEFTEGLVFFDDWSFYSGDVFVLFYSSSSLFTLLPVTPASPHVVETSLNSTFDDGLCVTVDVGLLFFLHDMVQTYIKENEMSSSGASTGFDCFVTTWAYLFENFTV